MYVADFPFIFLVRKYTLLQAIYFIHMSISFFLSLSSPSHLRVVLGFSALLPLFSGGFAGRRGWGRRVRPSPLYSCRSRLLILVDLGVMTLVWRGVLSSARSGTS
jgi:hypothetical protein